MANACDIIINLFLMQPRSQGLPRPQASVNKLRMPVFLPLVKIRLLLLVRWLITDTGQIGM